MRRLLICLFIVIALPAAAEKRVALVIGNDRYEAMRPLANAANDADTVGEALEGLGFEVFYERDRDRRRMERAIEDLEYDGEGAEVAVVYFAGHGFEVGGDNRVLPVDGDPTDLDSLMETSLSLGEIRERVARIAPVAVVLVDACRVSPFEGAEEGRAAVALKGGEVPGFAAVPKAEGTLIGFSTAPGAVALDGEGDNSPFAAALARHLSTPGIEVRSVLTLVQQEVYDRTRGAQLPYVESALPRLFFAAGQSDELPERERLLLAMADLTPDLRAEVERVAVEADVPLAPIYGALLAADLTAATPSERAAGLSEAAQAFLNTQAQLRSLSAADSEVAEMRARAEARLELGDFTGALGALDEAVALDRASGDALVQNLVSRRLSQAETLGLKAGVARTRLDYALALEVLGQAEEIHKEIAGLEVPLEERLARIDLYREAGETYGLLGEHANALAAFQGMRDLGLVELEADEGNVTVRRKLYLAFVGIAKAQKVLGDTGAVRENAEYALLVLRKGEGEGAERRHDLDVWEVRMLAGDVAIFLGDYSSARDDLNEAARRLLPHAEAEPGDIEVQRRLAETYERRGDAEMGLGEAERAFDTYWEALDIHGDLPHGQGGRNDLAVGRSAMKAGRALSMAGNPTPALRYLTRAERYLRDRFEADPQRAALRLALAQTLAGQAMAHGRGLELEEAEARARETLDMLAPLIAQTPGDTAARHIRFEALYELASVLWFLERHDEVQEVIKAAREEMELLREANPTHAGWIFDTVRLEMRAAHYATRMGDGAGALKRLLEARGYADILINQGGDNRRWRQLHLELNLDIQTEQRFARTEAELTDLLLTRTHIVLGRMWFLSQDPEDATSAMQLGEAYLRLGQTQLALSDPAKADESLRDAYDWLTSASARVGVSRPEFQAAEAAATLGELELNFGSVENAVAWHRIALDLRVALLKEVPGDRHRRWLLSVSREQLGNALAAQEGGLEAGIVEHEIARDMRLNLLEEVPTDWAVTWGLFVSYFQLADFGADPAANFARALAVLERMERAERLSPGQAEYLAVTRERIAEIGQPNQEDEAPAKTP